MATSGPTIRPAPLHGKEQGDHAAPSALVGALTRFSRRGQTFAYLSEPFQLVQFLSSFTPCATLHMAPHAFAVQACTKVDRRVQ
jgi:hypothetical protein